MDRHTKEVRSYNMSRVKSKNTKPELYVFDRLEKLNITFDKHYKTFGSPDVAIADKKIAVFISGEFWHGRNYRKEKDKYQEFWRNKIKLNIKRDRRNFKLLKAEGWTVIRIWDKDLKKNPDKEIKKIITALVNANQ